MKSLLGIIASTALVNNFVLVKFLGLCPILGVSNRLKNALGMALATLFVLTLTAGCSHLIEHYLLHPYQLEHLRLLTFIFTIAAIVQSIEMLMRAYTPLLHQVLGLYLPLITTNCAVLGVALLTVGQQNSFSAAIATGFGAGLGFTLVLIIFASLRERLDAADTPACWRGTPIALVTAGILSLAFMGFSGMVAG